MPVTIGQVLHYGQTQCELPVQRATIQMLANWLRDEYTHSNCNTSVFRGFPKLNTAECLKKENGSEEKYLVSIDAIS